LRPKPAVGDDLGDSRCFGLGPHHRVIHPEKYGRFRVAERLGMTTERETEGNGGIKVVRWCTGGIGDCARRSRENGKIRPLPAQL